VPPPHAQGDAKRLLLSSLTKSLAEVLPFLQRVLELNFGAAGQAAAAGQRDAAEQHVRVIQAALATANTYSGAASAASCGLRLFSLAGALSLQQHGSSFFECRRGLSAVGGCM
jgi:hypothetical protein